MPTILVATRDGLRSFDDGGRPGEVEHAGRSVTSLARAGDDHWAVLDGSEVWQATRTGWAHVTDLEGLRVTCLAGMGREVVVGSSEAHLFRRVGDSLERFEAFDRAEGRDTWFTPWGGPPDTRSIANWDERVYVNVHVGGILRTDDGGSRWTPTIDVEADVHQVTTFEDRVLAACAGGLAVSEDRGTTWRTETDGLDHRYARAVAVCGERLLLSTSRGPRGGEAAVYRAALGGGAFERCRGGLPEWFDGNVDSYHLDALPEDGSFAAFGTADGRMFGSTDEGSTWDELVSGLPTIQRVLVMP
jgi:hypothetical protein